jgi:hypothetical protein
MISLDAITKIAGGSTGGASLALVASYALFVPEQQFARHVAEERTATVQTLIETLVKEPEGAYHGTLCRTLEQTLAAICLDSPSHPFCADRMVLLDKAGCK